MKENPLMLLEYRTELWKSVTLKENQESHQIHESSVCQHKPIVLTADAVLV